MNKINNTEFEDKILILFDGVCSLCNVLIKILDRIPNNNKIIIPFSCISLFERYANKMAVTNGSSIREDKCIGVSGGLSIRPFKKDVYINLGFFASIDFRNQGMFMPFLNVEFYLFNKNPLFGDVEKL